MSDDDEQLSHLDRASLRILASTTRSSGGGKRVAERLDRAAGTGLRTDYSKAENSFNALDPEKRRVIGTKAETKAQTERNIKLQRKKAATKPVIPVKKKADDDLNWQPIVQDEAPEEELFELTLDDAVKDDAPLILDEDEDEDELEFEMDLEDEVEAAPEPAPVIPVKKKLALPVKKKAPQQKKKKKIPDDPFENNWDWQKLPEDPLLKARGEKKKLSNPLEELRQQMLGGSGGNDSW